MRDIKFRAWNTDEDRYVDGFSIRSDGVICSPWGKDKPEWILEQFTGLRDKNGREIYEGDIIRDETFKKDIYDIMVVGWENDAASFVLIKNGWVFMHYFGESSNPEDCIVIGNIHENPELIEASHV